MSRAVRGQLGGRFRYAVHKALFKGFIGVHPRGFHHHVRGVIPGNADAGTVHVENTLFAGAKDGFRFVHVPLISVGHRAGVVDHEQAAGRHLQPVRRHAKDRRGGSRGAGNGDFYAAGICANIVKHPRGGVAGPAIAVQTDVHIVRGGIVLSIEQFMQTVRGDFIAEPALLIDVAVQAQFPQWPFLLVRLFDFGGSCGGCSCVGCSCWVSSVG